MAETRHATGVLSLLQFYIAYDQTAKSICFYDQTANLNLTKDKKMIDAYLSGLTVEIKITVLLTTIAIMVAFYIYDQYL